MMQFEHYKALFQGSEVFCNVTLFVFQASRDVNVGELLIVSHAYYACHRSNITQLMKGIFERVAGQRLSQFEDSKTL